MAVPSTEIFNKYKIAIESLQKLSECAICLEPLKTELKLCSRGHMMCSSCVVRLESCPLCKAKFSIENPVGVRNLLAALPRVCRFASEGCLDIYWNGNDHESFCGYRPEACRQSGCQCVVPVSELLKHYQTKHPMCYNVKNEFDSMSWRKFDTNEKYHSSLPAFLFDNFFWIITTNDIQEKQLKIMLQVVPSGKPAVDYYACVEFKNNKFSYSYTIKAHVRKSLDTTKNKINEDQVCNENEYCMKIPTAELKRFINKEGNLNWQVTFFKDEP